MRYTNELLISTSVYAERILNFFNYSKSYEKAIPKVNFSSIESFFSIKNLTKKINDKIILDNVSFEIPINQKVAIVGLSVEGKSTLINILFCLDKDYEGSVEFNKINIKNLSFEDIIKYIQFYYQKPEIFNLDLKENITLGSEYDENLYNNILELLSIDYLSGRNLGDNGSNISGGEVSKVSFARFLYNISNKPFFILDEPFLSLDSITRNNYIKILNNYLNSKTGILISHDFAIIKSIANYFIVLKDGKIIESGNNFNSLEKDSLAKKLHDSFYQI